jgi:hypothetical protein
MNQIRNLFTLLTISLLASAALSASETIKFDFSPHFSEKFGQKKTFQSVLKIKSLAAQNKPVIDGKLTDPVWQKKSEITFGKGDSETYLKVCHDKDTLYLAFTCVKKPGTTASATLRARDGRTWVDDSIELAFLDPRDTDVNFLFIINAKGSVYDKKKKIMSTIGRYNPEFETAAFEDEKNWYLEIALPASALGFDSWPRLLPFNPGRNGPEINNIAWWKRMRDPSKSVVLFDGVKSPVKGVGGKTESDFAGNCPVAGDFLQVFQNRENVSAGERWAEIDLNIPLEEERLKSVKVSVKVLPGLGSLTPVATAEVVPERQRGMLKIDLRKLGLKKGEVIIAVLENNKSISVGKCLAGVDKCREPLTADTFVPVMIDIPENLARDTEYTVTACVPFPNGALWDMNEVILVDKDRKPLPQQKEIMGLWAKEGSIKWLRFDVTADAENGCFLTLNNNQEAASPAAPLTVAEADGKVIVKTGDTEYILAKGKSPIVKITKSGKVITDSKGSDGLYLVDQSGRKGIASADEETMLVESKGEVAACIRFEGWYKSDTGENMARHITRLEFGAGDESVKITHTLVLTEDTNKVWFKEIGWDFAFPQSGSGKAVFSSSYNDFSKTSEVALADNKTSAYMLQDSHYLFAHNKNHFSISRDTGGRSEAIAEGDECGDYAVITGQEKSLGIVCSDAARQHPKEFTVSPGKLTLKLFSSRSGEELDFRVPTLLKKWDVETWQKQNVQKHSQVKNKNLPKVLKNYNSNAAGWSKTHTLAIVPQLKAADLKHVQDTARKLRHPVYAHVDPYWIYKSRALGPLYPKNEKRFPDFESANDFGFKEMKRADNSWGEYGFVDYANGPRFMYTKHGEIYWPAMKRYAMLQYLVRQHLWLKYARSSDREIREYTEKSIQSYIDGRLGHWDTPTSKNGLPNWPGYLSLPFNWSSSYTLAVGETSSMNYAIWSYYLTGNRRSKDVMLNFAENIKKYWNPVTVKGKMGSFYVLWHLIQSYGFTWDKELRDRASATMDILEDKNAAAGINKYAMLYSATVKGSHRLRIYIDAWKITGERRYLNVADKMSNLFLNRDIGGNALSSYMPGMGTYGPFLYDRYPEKRKMLGGWLWNKVKEISALNQVTIKDNATVLCSARRSFLDEAGYALHLVNETNADKEQVSSWLAFDNVNYDTEVYVKKGDYDDLKILYKSNGAIKGPCPIIPVNATGDRGQDTFTVTAKYRSQSVLPRNTRLGLCGKIEIPVDMKAEIYKFAFDGYGGHRFYTNIKVPMVLYAPNYWYPEPKMKPSPRYYFSITDECEKPQIFFEGLAKLYLPSGKAYSGEPLKGWIDLPKESKGIWSFEPVEIKVVKVKDIPPFFAMGSKNNYFLPKVAWKNTAKEEAPLEFVQNEIYLKGAVKAEGNKSLYLKDKAFTIPAGDLLPENNGSDFLPQREGTIEFFFNPAWSTTDLPASEPNRKFAFAHLGKGFFRVQYDILDWDKQMIMFFSTNYHNDPIQKGQTLVRRHKGKVFFNKGKWHHIAICWGGYDKEYYAPKNKLYTANDVMTCRIYINGKKGRLAPGEVNGGLNGNLVGAMKSLLIGSKFDGDVYLNGAIDELRVSDIKRYEEDFSPPSRKFEFNVDKNTRALFHFNGNLDGESVSGKELKGQLKR